MGTIVARKRKDGTWGYTAQIVRKKKGEKTHREAQTFDRKQAANAWMVRREEELEKGVMPTEDPPLRDVITKYVDETEKKIGRTKAQCLRSIKEDEIADKRCSKIVSNDYIDFLKRLKVAPVTRANYLSHLGAIVAIARPAWGYPLDQQAMKDAQVVAKKLGLTGKGKSRDRRPTIEELDMLMDHFGVVKARRPDSIPMQKIIPFAIFSTRRQEEITLIEWAHYDVNRVLVKNMKHPGDKEGNDTWVDLPPEACAYIDSMPRIAKQIFPFTTDAIGAAFTRACLVLGINTEDMPDEERLHFHDLRHDGVSRLFEMGRTIPQAAGVSGHRSCDLTDILDQRDRDYCIAALRSRCCSVGADVCGAGGR